jgi:hypothetical protein
MPFKRYTHILLGCIIVIQIKTYRFHCDEIRSVVKEMDINEIENSSVEVPPRPHETLPRPFALHERNEFSFN